MNTFVYSDKYDDATNNTDEVVKLHSKGVKVVCYKCGTELLVLPDRESAAKHQKRPGIYCPVSEEHVCVWFGLISSRNKFWQEYDKKRDNASKHIESISSQK